MANKRLTVDDMNRMKNMVSQGVAPEDIAKYFNIAISSVHNYKARFKAEGLKFPSVRGKRPTGSVEQPTSNRPKTSGELVTKTDGYNFMVNGVSIRISGEPKSVVIGKKSIEVNF